MCCNWTVFIFVFICVMIASFFDCVARGGVIKSASKDSQVFEKGSGDDDDVEGSTGEDTINKGTGSPTPCRKVQQALELQGVAGAYMPRCSDNGEVIQMQCHNDGVRCWCVDNLGKEVKASESHLPPNCTIFGHNSLRATGTSSSLLQAPGTDSHHYPLSASAAITIQLPITPTTLYQLGNNNSQEDEVEVSDVDQMLANSTSRGESAVMHAAFNVWTRLLTEPLLVSAAFIIAILLILAVTLLILCIVYRLRKKDEGSYALDEPHRVSGLSASRYSRAPSQDREFFA